MEGNREESPGISLPRRIGGALLAGALAYGMAFSIAEAIPYDLPVILVAGLVGALVFVLDGSSILKIGRLAFNVLPRSRRLLVVLTVVPLVFYVAWAVTRTHLTREAIATVERVMPTGSVIVNPAAENNTAAAICWTDRIRGVCIDFRAWNRYGPAETLRRIGATHVFLDAGKPPESQLPEEIRRAYEIEKVMDVRLKHKTYAVFVLRTR